MGGDHVVDTCQGPGHAGAVLLEGDLAVAQGAAQLVEPVLARVVGGVEHNVPAASRMVHCGGVGFAAAVGGRR